MTLRVRFFVLLTLVLISATTAHAGDSLDQTASNFVTGFWAGWSQDNETALPYVKSVVADPIIFYGKSINLEKYMNIQMAFAERWPNRKYSIEQGTLNTSCNDIAMTCSTSGVVDWVDESPIRHMISTGSAKFKFNISFSNAGNTIQPKIVAETGVVLSRKLTSEAALPDQASASNQNVAAAPPVVIPDQTTPIQSSLSASQAYSSVNEDSKKSSAASVIGIIGGAFLLWILGGILLYFAPWIVALGRGVSSSFGIFAINLLFGWTFLGWIVAMIMALTAQTKVSVAIQRETLRHLRSK